MQYAPVRPGQQRRPVSEFRCFVAEELAECVAHDGAPGVGNPPTAWGAQRTLLSLNACLVGREIRHKPTENTVTYVAARKME